MEKKIFVEKLILEHFRNKGIDLRKYAVLNNENMKEIDDICKGAKNVTDYLEVRGYLELPFGEKLYKEYENVPIEYLKLDKSVYNRFINLCHWDKITSLAEVLRYGKDYFVKHRNFGKRSADKVEETIKEQYGLLWK